MPLLTPPTLLLLLLPLPCSCTAVVPVTVTVSNTGGITLSNVAISWAGSSVDVDGCSTISAPIPPGRTGECTADAKPTQTNLNDGVAIRLTATASISQPVSLSVPSANTVQVTADQQPAMTLDITDFPARGATYTQGENLNRACVSALQILMLGRAAAVCNTCDVSSLRVAPFGACPA